MKTLLWLDDCRDPNDIPDVESNKTWIELYSPIERPFEVIWAKSYTEFVNHIVIMGLPDAVCFDHDLGKDVALANIKSGMSKRESKKIRRESTKSGKDCANWLVNYCLDRNLNIPLYSIQSFNPVGKENIDSLLKSYKKHYENKSQS
jgi:hypothetical protein